MNHSTYFNSSLSLIKTLFFFRYEFHYNINHNNECFTCKKLFFTLKMLEIHNLEKHDSLFQIKLQQNMAFYECFDCQEIFKNARERFNHLISQHNYNKNELSDFDIGDENFNAVSSVTKRSTCTVPNSICFGENPTLGFCDRRIKIAKRKK
jgi:hypothetical protein